MPSRMIIDGGACDVGIESTIVAFTGNEPVLLRPGGIGVDDLARVLGTTPRTPDATAPRASGTLDSHYAPHTPARRVAAMSLAQESMRSGHSIAVLARTTRRPPEFGGMWIAAPLAPAAYAHDLYANLRTLDAAGAELILVEDVPEFGAWFAVHDRLARATS